MASKNTKTTVNTEPDVIDIDLSVTRKKRFRIDQDNDRILELNTSDFNIVSRLQETYPKLTKMAQEAMSEVDIKEDTTQEELLDITASVSRNIDKKMRDALDYIFDANVSEVCAPSGTMFDLFNGQFRFEHIIDRLAKLYENNMEAEYKQIQARIKQHTSKYIKNKK